MRSTKKPTDDKAATATISAINRKRNSPARQSRRVMRNASANMQFPDGLTATTSPCGDAVAVTLKQEKPDASLSRQRRHVDYETILHIAFEHALIGFIDVCNLDHLNIGSNAMFSAEIQHFLGFLDTADQRTGQMTAFHDQAEHVRRRMRRFGSADQCHRTLALE